MIKEMPRNLQAVTGTANETNTPVNAGRAQPDEALHAAARGR